jgi:hypothetical protein
MISVSKGDTVVVRDVLKCPEWSVSAMAAIEGVIITADDTFFIERFDGEGWNPSRTRRIVGRS